MNKEQLNKSLHYRMRLRPIARRFDGKVELEKIDDDWIVIKTVSGRGIQIKNIRTDHAITLAYDHIRTFMSDTSRPNDGLKYGFLELTIQVSISGYRIDIEPIRR